MTRDAIDRLDKNFKVKAIKDFKDLIWADIVIDDLNFGWYSSTAMQAMALGKVVVSHIDDNLRHYLPLPNPIFNTSSDNLLKKLNDILNNWEGSCGRGQVARQFIKNNHCKDSHKLVMDNFLIKEEIEDMGCADHLFNSNNVQGDSEIQSASLAKLTKQVKVLKSKVKKLHSAYLKRGEYLNKLKKALSKKTQSASSRTARKPRLLTMAGRLLKKKTK